MSANQAVFSVRTMARVLGVSTSGHSRMAPPIALGPHRGRRRCHPPDPNDPRGLLRHPTRAPRVHAELRAQGVRVAKKRVARLMRAASIAGVSRRRGGPVTTWRDPAVRPSHDLVGRDFAAPAPNALGVADVTYVPTMAGFAFLAVVLDAWSRASSGGRSPATSERGWSSTPSTWRWSRGGLNASSTIPIKDPRAVSTGRRDRSTSGGEELGVQGLGGWSPSQRRPGPAVERGGDGLELAGAVEREVGALGEVPARQPAGRSRRCRAAGGCRGRRSRPADRARSADRHAAPSRRPGPRGATDAAARAAW